MAADKRTGKKSFKCSTCNKYFNATSTLTKIWGFTATRGPTSVLQAISALNEQQAYIVIGRYTAMIDHEKPYECTQCDKCFRWPSG